MMSAVGFGEYTLRIRALLAAPTALPACDGRFHACEFRSPLRYDRRSVGESHLLSEIDPQNNR